MCRICLKVESDTKEVTGLVGLPLLVGQPGDALREEGVDVEGLALFEKGLLDILASASSLSISVLCFRKSSPGRRKACTSRALPQSGCLHTVARKAANYCTLGAYSCLWSFTFNAFAYIFWVILCSLYTPGQSVRGSRVESSLASDF